MVLVNRERDVHLSLKPDLLKYIVQRCMPNAHRCLQGPLLRWKNRRPMVTLHCAIEDDLRDYSPERYIFRINKDTTAASKNSASAASRRKSSRVNHAKQSKNAPHTYTRETVINSPSCPKIATSAIATHTVESNGDEDVTEMMVGNKE